MKRFTLIALSIGLAAAAAVLLGGLLWHAVPVAAGVASTQIDIVGPPGSGQFGKTVVALPNGNIVVADPGYDAPGPITDTGAVYLYNGATRALISTLTGSTAGDRVGSGGVVTLTNGNYAVRSLLWDNGVVTDTGAVTWGNGTTGITGAVTLSNSLVGSTTGDQVGYDVTPLTSGNYVVSSYLWDNGGVANAGAATWGNGTSGVSGVVSVTNSLVGGTAHDYVGLGVTALVNGNYVVRSYLWNNGGVVDVGAATWGNGTTGVTGVVSVSNSLVGGTANNLVGIGVTALANGNYVVLSPAWDNGGVADAGAATWANGTTGISGVVTLTNSLVGSTANDQVGYDGVTALANGNYVVASPDWDNGGVADVGAVTWGDGTGGVTGVVTLSNSLVGSTASDQVGYWSVTVLSNGNYVVSSPLWDNGGVANAGAATWGNGTTGVSGVVSVSNSLVGGTADDYVGPGVTALANGNYVVRSPYWDNGGVTDAGAATWGNGTTGVTGVVSVTNSLVGNTANDQVGNSGVTALANGNYVVRSPVWDNGVVTDTGAVTWGSGTTGITGTVTLANSLVGTAAGDWVGYGVTALANGNYVVRSPYWDDGGVADAGAVTWGNGDGGTRGTVTAGNSVRGTAAGGGTAMVFAYDYTNDQLVVGRPADNIVTLFRPHSYEVFLPLVLRNAP